MAPYVRLTYIEELERAYELLGLPVTDEDRTEKFDDYLITENIKEIQDPYVRGKKMAMNQTVRRVHQSMESFIHNLNTIHK